jgi:hypothetical protein
MSGILQALGQNGTGAGPASPPQVGTPTYNAMQQAIAPYLNGGSGQPGQTSFYNSPQANPAAPYMTQGNNQ